MADKWLQKEWPWTTLSGYLPWKSVFGKHSIATKMRLLEPTAQIWIKIDPYNVQQKCSPMILVSGNLGPMGIFAGVPLGRGLKWEWAGRWRQFLAIWMVPSSESSEIRPTVLYDDMLTLVGRQMAARKNDFEWLFAVKIRFRQALCCSKDASFGAHCTNLNEDRPIQPATKKVAQWS